MYYKCVKFHKIPISGLGGVALTRYMDGRTDGWTDWVIPIYPPPKLCLRGYKKNLFVVAMFVNGSEINEQSLLGTFQGCFLPYFESFGQAVTEEKIL